MAGACWCAAGASPSDWSASINRHAAWRPALVRPADLKQLWALVPVLIAVTGRVLAPKPYRCEMSDSEAAIVEVGFGCLAACKQGISGWLPPNLISAALRHQPCCVPCPQMREEKKSERRAGGNAWVPDSQLLRETVKEAAWALGDGRWAGTGLTKLDSLW